MIGCGWHCPRRMDSFGWLACAQMILLGAAAASQGMVLVEAHRGYSAIAPENTLASIRAGEGIADLTEWDVYPTADGVLVLMHDPTVDRTTDGMGAVSSLTLAQIKALDACYTFCSTYAGEPVPTMAEAIAQAHLSGIMPLIERKAGSPLQYQTEFTSLGLDPSSFRMISFDWSFLSSMNAYNPAYNLGALGSGAITQSTISGLKAQGIDFLDWSHTTVTQSEVDLVHANNMELHVWTVDDPFRMQQLIDFGVDGITTDDPETLMWLAYRSSPDLNRDGVINEIDWQWYHSGRGVDLTGLSLLEAYQMGDMDGDFDNDIADFVRFKELSLGSMGTLQGGVLLVPEPASSACMACSIVLLLGRRTRWCISKPNRADGCFLAASTAMNNT